MLDTIAGLIANTYADNYEQAKRVSVDEAQAPFVAVCLTILQIMGQDATNDFVIGESLDRKMTIIEKNLKENT